MTSPHQEATKQRVATFRDRLSESDLHRKEVLVSGELAQTLTHLAKLHQTSVVNVASALLEIGVQQYQTQYAAAPLFPGPSTGEVRAFSGAIASACQFPEPAAARAESLALDPITAFFNRRKEPRNG